MPEAYMRFKVQCDLKNYSEAILEVVNDEDESHFDEAMNVIKKHRLFRHALKVFEKQEARVL